MVVDNLLMSGEVALPEDAETWWNADSLASARRLNVELRARTLARLRLAVGDGIGVARAAAPALADRPAGVRSASRSSSAFCILPVTSS